MVFARGVIGVRYRGVCIWGCLALEGGQKPSHGNQQQHMAKFDPMGLVGLFHILIKLPKWGKDTLFFEKLHFSSFLRLLGESPPSAPSRPARER